MKKLLLTGGGTLGPVTPLLALVDAGLKNNKDWQFEWVGTNKGPEKKLIDKKIPYHSIVSAKFDRFLSWQNFLAPVLFIIAFAQAIFLLIKIKPDLIVSAGGFTAVPVGYAGFVLRVPILIHEQDVEVGLANKMLRPIVRIRTSVFGNEGSIKVGNLIRTANASENYKLPEIFDETKPYIVITGGGTGAKSLNEMVVSALPTLTAKVNVLHLTGLGKSVKVLPTERYHQLEFLEAEMLSALAGANVVVSRAGMGTLSELAYLSKPVVLVPIPNSHQMANARLVEKNEAGVILVQTNLTSKHLAAEIVNLVEDINKQQKISQNLHSLIPEGTATVLNLIDELFTSTTT